MYLSVINLNGNGLNAPTKRHSIAEWIRKQDRQIDMLPPRDTSQIKRYKQIKSKEMEKCFLKMEKKKNKPGITILISNKIDF